MSTEDLSTKKTETTSAILEDESPAFAWPTVVAVVVTHNPGVWLEECLKSLNAEKYPDLSTLIMDVSSEADVTERVAKTMPGAYVRKVEDDINFAETINEAVNSIEGATYVLICHDDVVLKTGSIAALVEEAFRSNASIVGPKIIDADRPDILLEVGGMIDRFGVPFNGIEPDEVDQGQHDGVRDVFYVSSATMLVRADLFRALGGFDPKCFPGAEDIDLAWRAHLVGARVLVQPDAVIKHHEASDRQRKSRTSAKAIVARHRMRAVLKNASKRSLMWIIPMAFILHSIEGIAFLFKLDPRRAFLLFKGWIWNIAHLKETRKARAEIQKTREVSDRDIANHQVGGSARIRRFFTFLLRNRQLKKISKASRAFSDNKYVRQTRESPIYFVAFIAYLVAIRSLITNGVGAVGQIQKWAPLNDQLEALTHGGLPVASDPMLSSTMSRLIAIVMTVICFGNYGLAQTLFIASLIPIGVQGLRLLLKDREIAPHAIAAGAITYALFGIGVFLFSIANFSAMILMAALPYFVRALSRQKIRQVGLSAAVMIAFVPSAIIICLILSLVFVVVGHQIEADALEFGRFKALRLRLKAVILSGALAALINVGLIVDSVRVIDRNTLGLSDTSRSLIEYLLPNTQITILLYMSIAISASALLICRNSRTSDIRVLAIAISFVVILMAGLILFAEPLIDLGAIYALAQMLTAISAALIVNAYEDELKIRTFGWAHILAALSLLAVLVGNVISAGVLVNGRYSLPSRSWAGQIVSEENERVLYLGNARFLPGQSILAPYQRSLSLSIKPDRTIMTQRIGPASSLDDDIRDIYSAIMNQETSHAGALFARMGIGTVVVPYALGPENDINTKYRDNVLLESLDAQVDLVRLKDRNGLIVYQNSALTKTYTPTTKVEPFSPVSIFNVDRANPTAQPQGKESVANKPLTWGVTLATSTLLFLCIVWPRRKRLIDSTSTSFAKVVAKTQSAKEKKALQSAEDDTREDSPEGES